MSYDFDRIIERRGSDSMKWQDCGEGDLALWVADMDFAAPPAVTEALRRRIEHPVYGYGVEPPRLRELIVERLEQRYGWEVEPEAIVFMHGVVPGFHFALRALLRPGQTLLIQTPVYPPILHAAEKWGLQARHNPLRQGEDGRYEVDFDDFESQAAQSDLFLLCNPHNPVGRVFRREELERMAEIALRYGLPIVSDEIHADFIYPGHAHLPIATLDRAVERRTITLMAPSKTFNIAGLECSYAIIPDEGLRERYRAAMEGLSRGANILGYVAAQAAYESGEPWLRALLRYLEANRDFVAAYVADHLPGVRMAVPEGTFLAWLDCREAVRDELPGAFFRREAHLHLNEGLLFGEEGRGFVRLNFGTPRALLKEALDRMAAALR